MEIPEVDVPVKFKIKPRAQIEAELFAKVKELTGLDPDNPVSLYTLIVDNKINIEHDEEDDCVSAVITAGYHKLAMAPAGNGWLTYKGEPVSVFHAMKVAICQCLVKHYERKS